MKASVAATLAISVGSRGARIPWDGSGSAEWPCGRDPDRLEHALRELRDEVLGGHGEQRQEVQVYESTKS